MLNIAQELTMLYLNKKDISVMSPTELVSEYRAVYEEINKAVDETSRPTQAETFKF